MYSEFLGEGYHEKIRKMLGAKPEMVPDSMIDAEANIGAMKGMIAPNLDKIKDSIGTEKEFQTVGTIARYYLAAILCVPLKQRGKRFGKGRVNWDKKREKYVMKGNRMMKLLIDSKK